MRTHVPMIARGMNGMTRIDDNVPADPWVPDPDQHRLKTGMAVVIGRAIKSQGLTEAAAAARLGIARSDLSQILCGQFSGYSLPRLIAMASALTGIAP